MTMKKITNIIVHCSDSEFGSASMIRQWHLKNGWKDIGYHFVIDNGLLVPKAGNWQTELRLNSLDGSIEVGRYLDGDSFISDNEVGAHALGYNGNSIGLCLIGVKSFTPKQFNSLAYLLKEMLTYFGLKKDCIKGHYQVCKNKTCPNFDVPKFVQERL